MITATTASAQNYRVPRANNYLRVEQCSLPNSAMTTKYAIARELIDQLHQYADSNGLDKTDVEEATLILLIQALKNSRGSESMRGLLQYEIDNLGTSVFEIQRGSGHS